MTEAANIYTPPEADLELKSTELDQLASRWQRLWASMIDSLCIMVVVVPTMYFTGAFEGIAEGVQPELLYKLAIALLGLVIFCLINVKMLLANGQTLGKKLLGIKIVDLDGNLPEPKKHLLKRYATYFVPGQVPVIGQLFSFINILFIFGKQKRCIHDLVGGTKVVKC